MKHHKTILSVGVIGFLTLAAANANAQKENPSPQSDAPKTEAVQTPSDPTSQKTKSAELKDNPVICKNVKMEGTRLRKRKVCKTKELWDAERKKMNDDLDKSRRAVYTGS